MKETLHIYCRVSTKVQEEGASLDVHRDEGKKKAKDLGMKAKVWNEGAASSHHEDLLNRPKLMELMNEIENGSAKHLFVFNNDRLSRNDITQQTIKLALQRSDAILYTKDAQFDLSNPSDRLTDSNPPDCDNSSNIFSIDLSESISISFTGRPGVIIA